MGGRGRGGIYMTKVGREGGRLGSDRPVKPLSVRGERVVCSALVLSEFGRRFERWQSWGGVSLGLRPFVFRPPPFWPSPSPPPPPCSLADGRLSFPSTTATLPRFPERTKDAAGLKASRKPVTWATAGNGCTSPAPLSLRPSD